MRTCRWSGEEAHLEFLLSAVRLGQGSWDVSKLSKQTDILLRLKLLWALCRRTAMLWPEFCLISVMKSSHASLCIPKATELGRVCDWPEAQLKQRSP